MCGIVGYRLVERDGGRSERDLPAAVAQLAHRGPDDEGTWADPAEGLGLGFRRLSILDLSSLGHQPMVSASGDWVMVYNGEVYNFRDVRRDLERRGVRFRSSGDTEVVLEAFAEWGLDAVSRFIGMFAIALVQRSTGTLCLVRDRLGVKPLHYYWDGRSFFFGSELKALREFGGWTPEIDADAVGDYFRYGYIADPLTIYRNVGKLPPAHILTLSRDGALDVTRYWSPLEHTGRRAHLAESDVVDEFESLLRDAFALRLVSDVPVGVFLSGGIDSSLVTALLCDGGAHHVQTYTIGFESEGYDESGHAAAVAAHLGTDHHEKVLRAEDARRVLPHWPELYDEPFADESGIATLLVSQFASERVKVALSADGGDELFSGYDSYTGALSRLDRLARIPPRVRELAARSAAVPASVVAEPGRVRRVRRLLAARGAGDVFEEGIGMMSREEVRSLIGRAPPERTSSDSYPGSAGERFCAWDLHHYLPGDLLTKVDRATMAASLEGREPLLDHRVVEFAFSLPFSLRRGELGTKHLLKRILYRHVPRGLVDRPKRGFAVPVTEWLAGDLRSVVDDALAPTELARTGILEPAAVRRWVARMDGGDARVRRRIWLVVAFQLWHRRWLGS
jgi:asparagine synthase (glutamine-hydrolysing)